MIGLLDDWTLDYSITQRVVFSSIYFQIFI